MAQAGGIQQAWYSRLPLAGVDRTICEKLQTCMNLHKLLQEYGGFSRCEAELHSQTSSSAF